MTTEWPKDITEWHNGTTGYLSVPFTWLLPKAKQRVLQGDMFTCDWVVGGPAVRLMPDYLAGWAMVEVGGDMPGVLQRVNPLATRTTEGCPHRCRFCGVGQRQLAGDFKELESWPLLPVVCDDNLLAASHEHFDRVMYELRLLPWCDIQGLDIRLVTAWHALRLAKLQKPVVRLALDSEALRDRWADAVDVLLTAGIAKSRLRSYLLCGFESGPDEDRDRCEFVESFGLKALPMWFHELDAMELNAVTDKQRAMGWTNRKRRELMCWYYQHRTLAVRG